MPEPIEIAPGVHRLGSPMVNWYSVEDGGSLTVPQNNESRFVPYLRYGTAWRLLAHLARGRGLRPPKISDPVVFADGETLDVPGRPRVLRTPGHTDGHCAIQFEPLDD
jgi:glyoxylase-like metal-dependent hydrolase (beta-lactamase superfamily II)